MPTEPGISAGVVILPLDRSVDVEEPVAEAALPPALQVERESPTHSATGLRSNVATDVHPSPPHAIEASRGDAAAKQVLVDANAPSPSAPAALPATARPASPLETSNVQREKGHTHAAPQPAFATIATSRPSALAAIEAQRICVEPGARSAAAASAPSAIAARVSTTGISTSDAEEMPALQKKPREAGEPVARRFMHVFTEEGAASVWVRDAALEAPQAQGLAARIAAELAGAGKRLAAFTLNGRPVFTRKKGR
jgi:hypothetical protein